MAKLQKKLVREIKKLKIKIFYKGLYDRVWEGYTQDTCEDAYKKGFVRVYEAYSCSKGSSATYRKCAYVDIPFNGNMHFHPNPNSPYLT